VDFENIIRSRGAEYHTASHQDALKWLATKPDDWLVIMDNADDPSFHLSPYIVQSSCGNIIITTRNANQAMLAPNSSHHLEGLSTEDAIALILAASGYEHTEENRALARAIVEVLGHLPLALIQAAGYIFINKCLSTYILFYERSAVKLLATRSSGLPYDYPSSVAATIQMSLDRLPTQALNILQIFAHLDSTSIPHAIVTRAADREFRRVEGTDDRDLGTRSREQAEVLVEIFFSDGKWSEVDFNALITCCLQYSLLRLTTLGGSTFYSMHILVQSYLRAKEDLIWGHQPGPLVVRLLGSSTTVSSDSKYIAFNRLLLPHLRQIRMEDVVEAGDHFGFGHVMERAGENRLAVLHLERSVEMWRESLGDEHANTLAAMANLAISYKTIGNFQRALELEEKVLDVERRTLGSEHRNTLVAAGNLATSYRKLRRHRSAVSLKEHVLEIQRVVLGPEDAHTVMTMGNLALSYGAAGRTQEALELGEQVLEIQKRILGPEDPGTLWTMSTLAESYRIVGRMQEALELSRHALEMQKRILGDEHPDTLYSIFIRLDILRDLGMTEQLRDLLRVALPAHEKVLGLDHPYTIGIREEFETEFAQV
jgi:tetratricopeptide (TPR) repeat protein